MSTAVLDLLHQRYERRTETECWYEAPRFGYVALFEVTPIGFVRRYPGLWELEKMTTTDLPNSGLNPTALLADV